jgi:hypothetical protein
VRTRTVGFAALLLPNVNRHLSPDSQEPPPTGIPEIPLAPLVVEAIRDQLPPGADPDVLVFAGPGGGNHVAAGTRTVLSRHGIRAYTRPPSSAPTSATSTCAAPTTSAIPFRPGSRTPASRARVIDELMSRQRSRHGALEGGSQIGARYRHTTDAMARRVVEAIQERLTTALRVAEETQGNRQGTKRVF